MTLVRFLESGNGRLARGGVGIALVGVGGSLGALHGGAWWVLGAAGLLPLAAGVFKLCLAAPFVGGPVRGGLPRGA